MTEKDIVSAGPYRLLARCGSGRLGPIYLGRARDGTLAAVRVIHARLAGDEAFMAGLADHVARARAVRLASVAAILDVDLDAARPWYASEFVTGPSLSGVVGAYGPIGDIAAGGLMLRLAEALVDMHAKGVVHGDLRPSAVLLAADGPRLVDVGIALTAGSTSATQVGVTLDDPRFLSPEQALGDPAAAASDVFALASLVVYGARGVSPFEGGASALAVVRKVLGDPPDLSGIASYLADCLVPCFEKVPENRCSASELVDRLAAHPEIGDSAWPTVYHDVWMGEFA
jgi:serine/threonine protein kinase